MRRMLAVFGFATLVATASASLVIGPKAAASAAAAEETFVIPASDGYGVADCLSGNAECGKVVANAWCEAQGYVTAASFGIVAPEEVTGSTGMERSDRPLERPISITCTR